MDAIKAGIELHELLEEIFNRPRWTSPEKLEEIALRTSEPNVRRAIENYKTALEDLDRILTGAPPKLKAMFEETLRNDGVYEYTSTGSCDGSQSFAFRRKPALASSPSAWESIECVPEGAKYNND